MISVLLRGRCLSVPDWKRDRSQSAFVCLASPNRGARFKAEAAKRGRNSASLYGLTPVRFTVVGSKRPPASSDPSNSRFGRHETGSAIQRLMSDSCQPSR